MRHPAPNPKIIEFIRLLRDCHPDMARAGLFGKCLRVSKLLRAAFGGQAYHVTNPGHVLTRIGGVYYDITGAVKAPNPAAARRMSRIDEVYAETWDINSEACTANEKME